MPVPAEFDWSETLESVAFTIRLPSLSTRSLSNLGQRCVYGAPDAVDFIVSPFYVKLSAPPHFFEADLFDEIETKASTFCLTSAVAEGHFQLKKKRPAFWRHFSATHNPQLSTEEIRSRRLKSLETYESEQEEKRKREKSIRYQRQKTSQEEQWRIDRATREWLEKRKEEEKRNAIQSIFSTNEQKSTTATTQDEYERDTDFRASTPTEDRSRSSECPDEEGGARTRGIEEAEDHDGFSQKISEANSTFQRAALNDHEYCISEGDEALQLRLTSTVNEGRAATCDVLLAPPVEGGAHATFPTNNDVNATPQFIPHSEDARHSAAALPQGPTTKDETLPTTAATRQGAEGGIGDKETFVQSGSRKVTLNFTARKHYRLPARGDKIPPFPRNVTQPSGTKDSKKTGVKLSHEKDQQWLKDKGVLLLKNGDLCGAIEAFTEALKLVEKDVDCVANRSYAYLMLGDLDKCIEDCQHALGIVSESGKVPEGYPAPPLTPHNSRVRIILYNRLAVCCTWKGCFNQAELYFSKATEDVEGGENVEELERIREDGLRLKGFHEILETKLKADLLLRGNLESEAPCVDEKSGPDFLPYGKRGDAPREKVADKLAEAKKLYTYILEWAKPVKQYTFLAALSLTNRALASLRQEKFEESLNDSKEALQCLRSLNVVVEKSLRSTPEGGCWRWASVFSAGDAPRELSSSGANASRGASERDEAIVTKANERPFKNLLIKARLRKSSALEQLGRFSEALQDALETLRLDPFNNTAKLIARRATDRMEVDNLSRCTSKEPVSSSEQSMVLLGGDADADACHPQPGAACHTPGRSELLKSLRLEAENVDALLQAASAHLRRHEVKDALDLYRFAAHASRRVLLTRGEEEQRGTVDEEEKEKTQAEHREDSAHLKETIAERMTDSFTLQCEENNGEGDPIRATDGQIRHGRKDTREEEERLKRWLRFHRCRALANATFCLHKLNETQKVVDVATQALNEVVGLKSSLEAIDQNNEEPNYNELLRIECACLSRRGLAFRDLNRERESNDDQRSVQELLTKMEQCCV